MNVRLSPILRCIASLAVALTLAAATAQAQSPANVAAAEALYRQGSELMVAGKFAEACPKLEESQRLDPGGANTMLLAECLEKTGKTTSAWVRYQEARDIARRRGLTDKEKVLTDKIVALEPGLSKLRIVVPASVAALPGVEVRRDGALVGAGAWGAAIPADPGNTTLEVTAPGKKRWTSIVSVGATGALASVSVPELLDAPVETPTAAGPGRQPGETGTKPGTTGGLGTQRIAGYAVGGAGLLGIVVGGVFFVKALGKQADKNDAVASGHCLPKCDDFERGLESDRNSAVTTGTIVSVLGGAMTIGGIVLLATAPSRTESARSLRVNLATSSNGVSAGLAGTW